MKLRQVRLLLAALCALVCCQFHAQAPTGAGAPATPSKSALLIGINAYKHSPEEIRVPDGAERTGRNTPNLEFEDLKGSIHDVEAMRGLLTSKEFGFPNDDKHIHILLDKSATHDAILKAMQKYLVTVPKPGDTVVLYISSHGSVRVDPKGHGQQYDLDGTGQHFSYLENTIVPYDWYLGQDDIFSRDLRHIFNQAADRGIHLTAIIDSCHSGSLARGAASSTLVARAFPYDSRPMPYDPYPAETAGILPQDRTDNPVLVLSAAQKEQLAYEDPHSDPPRGVFTKALIETLQALPTNRPASDVFKRLQIAMEQAPDAMNQQPDLDTTDSRKEQPLFGGEAGSGPTTAAIVSVDAGKVVLDIGAASDIGQGSEFTELTETKGIRAVLRVTGSIGLAFSRATVISPPDAMVQTEDIVQLTKWVPAERPTLYFYAGASNLSLAEIQEALAVLRSANVQLTEDPSSESWTHHLAWDGAHWTLLAHSGKPSASQIMKENPVKLGTKLSPAALKRLPPESVVWFDAPLPKESATGLLPPPANGDLPSAAQLASDRAQAMYVIAGKPAGAGIKYAWYKRSDEDAEVQTPKGPSAGCSPNSPYPLHTDWFAEDEMVGNESRLTNSAVKLAKLNGWLHLDSSSLSGQTEYPLRLALRRVSEEQFVRDGKTYDGGNYELWLVSKARDYEGATPRWVYVLGIDCTGQGMLLWPHPAQAQGRFPSSEEDRRSEIQLPRKPFPVQEPLGTDTYLLLTTATELMNTSALSFSGVVTTRDLKRALMDPLEELLDSTSAGLRDIPVPTPTNWSVQSFQTQSLPGAPPTSAQQGPVEACHMPE
jgi:hypothetical protein